MIEVNIHTRRWYVFIKKPKVITKNMVCFLCQELDIAKYNPKIFVVLADDILLHELNASYRKIDKPTNVLSFNYEELSQNCCLGEIYLSLERIVDESTEMGIEIMAHFTHMIVHGVLHILGYDHETPEEANVMQNLEIKLLQKMGIENPYVPRES